MQNAAAYLKSKTNLLLSIGLPISQIWYSLVHSNIWAVWEKEPKVAMQLCYIVICTFFSVIIIINII